MSDESNYKIGIDSPNKKQNQNQLHLCFEQVKGNF